MKREEFYTHRYRGKWCRVLLVTRRSDGEQRRALIEVEGEKALKVVPRSDVVKAR